MPNNVTISDLQAELSDRHSEEAQFLNPDKQDALDAAGEQDGPSPAVSFAGADQPPSIGDESVEPADVTGGDSFRHTLTEIIAPASRSRTSGVTTSDTPKDTSRKADSAPTGSAEHPPVASPDNADTNGVSQLDVRVSPSEPPESAEPPKGKTRDENSRSPERKRIQKKAKPSAPREIGRRRKRPVIPDPLVTSTQDKPTSAPRPELICRKAPGSRQWQAMLTWDGECGGTEVRHNGERLETANGEYRLSSFVGQVSIAFVNGEPAEFLLCDGTTPLIFKLGKDWKGDGRKVGGVTNGHFIVMVPKEWHRKGNAPVEHDGCTDPGFIAHYFFRGRGHSAEDVDGFEEYAALLTQSSFALSGNRVFDDSEEGALFGGSVPELRPVSEVVQARVGEEREDGWEGENFRPAERTLAQVLDGRQGRFFVRVYDDDSKLLDSDEFRYCADLREILVDGAPYSETSLLVPSSTGHSPTEVQFIGVEGELVHPQLETDESRAAVRADGTVVVEPHPDGDALSCILGSDAAGVRVDVRLPRIWWRMGRGDREYDEWRDTPLTMTRQEFRDVAYANEAIRFRLPARVSSVNVGFDEELGRAYRPGKGGREVEISLTDFVDYSQIDQRLNEDALFNVRCRGTVLTLIRVSADPVPTIDAFTCEPTEINAGETATLSWTMRNAEPEDVATHLGSESVGPSGSLSVTPGETTTFTLKLSAPGRDDVTKELTVTVRTPPSKPFPLVKGGNGEYRRGRGFSPGEVCVAGLTVANAARLSFPVDGRRKSMHPPNIEAIKRLIDA